MGFVEMAFSNSALEPIFNYSDDPDFVTGRTSKKNISSLLALLLFGVVGTFLIQSTLAANIALNTGMPLEFGQGMSQTVACSGTSNITVTPVSNFVNASGSGTFKFTSFTVSDIPSLCEGEDFTINAYGNTSNTPVSLFATTSTTAVIYNDAGTFKLGVGTSGMSVASGSGTFTVTFTTPAASSSSISKITIQSGPHTPTCSEGGACQVGDLGPGGGYVYYIHASGTFTSTGSLCDTACKYLEVAPAGWNNAAGGYAPTNDGMLKLSTSQTLFGQDLTVSTQSGFSGERANWAIGKGFSNTSLIKPTSDAKNAVLAFAGNSVAGQWFIPSMNELNELCKYARGITTGTLTVACTNSGTLKTGTADKQGGFIESYYWSSTENSAIAGYSMHFQNGYLTGGESKDGTNRITRPVRAF